MIEKKLKTLFDYQCFEKNTKLTKLIENTESRYARKLTDEELFKVSAAGEPESLLTQFTPVVKTNGNYDKIK